MAEMRMARAGPRGGPGGLALVLLASLVTAACAGQGRGTSLRPKVGATPMASEGVNATPPPYPFAESWQAAAGVPTTVGGFAFAPPIGYACTEPSGTPGTSDVTPTPTPSGFPSFIGTTDGGATWTPLSTTLSLGAEPCHVGIDSADPKDVLAWADTSLARSRDGGRTWTMLSTPKNAPTSIAWQWHNATVIGSRIIAVGWAAGNANTQTTDDLYASDDNGQTWSLIGQSIQAMALNVGNFVQAGTMLYVSGYPICAGGLPIDGCLGDATLAAQLDGHSRTSSVPMVAPASGDHPVVYRYFASADAGKTFTELTIPGARNLSELSFTLAASGSAYYGVVLSTADDLTTTVYWSSDSGKTWTALPTLDGPAGSYADLRTLGILGRLVAAPDGTVIAGVWHDRQQLGGGNGGGDAGILRLRPGGTGATWQPLAPGGTYALRAAPQGTGVRLWSLPYTQSLWFVNSPQSGAQLEYVTLP